MNVGRKVSREKCRRLRFSAANNNNNIMNIIIIIINICTHCITIRIAIASSTFTSGSTQIFHNVTTQKDPSEKDPAQKFLRVYI